jgi:CHAD domain-containing protein
VVDAASAEDLNGELAWYADLLGEVRDREVLSARLTSLIDELPPEQVRGPVEAAITKTLATEHDDATQRLNEEMSSSRYQDLITLLRLEDRSGAHRRCRCKGQDRGEVCEKGVPSSRQAAMERGRR